MNGYRRGLDGPSFGTDCSNDLLGLVILFIFCMSFLALVDWMMSPVSADIQAPAKVIEAPK